MKKKISALLTVTLIFSFLSTVTFAADRESDIIKMHQNQISISSQNFSYEKPLSKDEINKKISDIQENYRKSHKSTESERKAALEKASRIESIFNTSNKNISDPQPSFNTAAASSSYDSNKAKLREGNFIEGILDDDEGMTASQIYALGITTANSARSIAASQYPNDVMLQDAYRHFTWNFISTFNSSLGMNPTYIGTVNHEWGLLLLEPMTNYYDSQYQSYISDGYSSENSSVWAFSDTVNYIPIMKETIVRYCKAGYSFFSGFMDASNIMDLTNNFEGRYYTFNFSASNYKGAFDKAIADGAIIKSESSVGDTQKRNLWNLQAYY
ncbi:hypothetical protein [Ruminiclostridium josui]|uniref:hypothetical protein n=1 Tax=Ruminiclostridium josui TaxID=1499 RepID=UPI0004671C75|nr:hypothetical protein [Ruminiclostridium josui]